LTVHIPRWVLFVAGACLIALVAFLVGRGSGDSSDAPTTTAGQATVNDSVETATALGCDKVSAREAIDADVRVHGDPVGTLADDSTGKLGGWVAAEVEDCQDLSGDEAEEMVVVADGVKAGGTHVVNWFVFGQENGEWVALLRRAQPMPDLSVSDSGVREETGIYRSGDPMCCASSNRGGEVRESGGELRYFPDIDPQNYKIKMNPATKEMKSFGPLDAYTSSASETMQYFGEPNSTGIPGSESCTMTWSDLGMIIDFVDLGGGNSCLSGRIGRFSLQGTAAAQVGWSGPNGLQTGMSLNDSEVAFPTMERDCSGYVDPYAPEGAIKWNFLIRPSPYGSDGTTPTISGYFKDDQLIKIEYGVGAGGE
jgi:hypothetical protein